MNDKVWIPRNLNNEDALKIGLGISLRASDLPFLFTNGCLTYSFTNGLNVLQQTLTYSIFLGGTYLLTRIKIKNQNFIELISNYFIFRIRKNYYKNKG